MRSPPLRSVHLAGLPILLAVGILALFVAIFCFPRDWFVDVGEPGDVRYLHNFHRYEYDGDTSFRWSSPQSTILPYGTHGGLAILSLRLHSDMPIDESTHHIQVVRHNRVLADVVVAGGWRTYDILLPPSTTPGFTVAPLHVQSNEYHADSHDGRELGIPVDSVRLHHLTGVSLPLWVPVQRACIVLWGLVLLAVVLWYLNRAMQPGQTTAAGVRHMCMQVGSVALLLACAAWLDPYLIAWGWLYSLWFLSIGTLILLVVAYWNSTRHKAETIYNPHTDKDGDSRKGTKARTSDKESDIFSHLSPVLGTAPLLFPLIICIIGHLLLLPPVPVSWQATGAWLSMGWSGALLLLVLCPEESNGLERLFLALCGGLIVPPLLLLSLQALPGPVPGWLLLVLCDAISVTCGWLLWKKTPSPHPLSHQRSRNSVPVALVTILLVATFFRFAFLGTAEFQGDEGQPMIMAAAMYQGYDDVLLMHRKGPMEILLPAVPMAVTGTINEWGARLPFAVASIATLIGCYLLTVRLMRESKAALAGLLAIGILTLDGFLIGFARIVQYQYVVLLMTVGAIWLCWRFYEGGPVRYLTLAAWFAAVGLLGHYDGIFGLPAMALLVVAGGLKRKWQVREWFGLLRRPVLVGGSLLTSFYLPFMLHEHFARTLDYLVTMRIGERNETGIFCNNLREYYLIMTFYNTIPQMQMVSILLAVAVFAWLLVYARPRIVGTGLALLLMAGCTVLVWNERVLQIGNYVNLAIVLLGVPVVALVIFPATPMWLRVVLLWFCVPFVAESFVIADPNTHFYTMHVPAALLIGMFMVQAGGWLQQRQMMWVMSPLIVAAVAVLLFSLPYTYMIFVQQYPEYKRDYPRSRPNIYLADYGDKSPRGGYFGLPHRDGWKAIAELYRDGVLQGNYDSNQKSLITTWYIRDGIRGGPDPMYYFAVRIKGNLFIPDDYYPFGSVYIEGRRILDMYSRVPLTTTRQRYDLEDYVTRFDARVINFPIQWQFLELTPSKKSKVKKNDGEGEF